MTSKPSAYACTPSARHQPDPDNARRATLAASTGKRHWLEDVERLRLYTCAVGVIILHFCLSYLYHRYYLGDYDSPMALDYLPLWGASHFVLHGNPLDAYNVELMAKAEVLASPFAAKLDGYMPWLYPPGTMLFVTPLALLPFVASYVVFALGGVVLFVAAVRRTAPWRGGWPPLLCFPGLAMPVIIGQSSLYTAGLSGFALYLLRRRPVIAGLCAGLLFFKPHLALLFPLAFLCARMWRAFFACVLTVVAVNVTAALVFGIKIYPIFLEATRFAQQSISTGNAQVDRVPSFYVMLLRLDVPIPVALAIHGAIAAAAVIYMITVWWRPTSMALRAAVLVATTFLVSPYLYDYDMSWFALLIAWYIHDGRERGWLRGEREWLAVLWLTPLFGLLIVPHVDFQFMPFITLATLLLLWRRDRKLAPARTAATAAPPRALEVTS